MAAFAKYEDSVLRKVLAVTLQASDADPAASPPVVHLAGLEKELAGEGAAPLLSRDSAERALMARLSDPPPGYPQWPVHYLMGVYGRASEEARSVGLLKDAGQGAALGDALRLCAQLAVSYSGLTLTLDMFPQPPEAAARGALQLLDALDPSAGAGAGGAPPTMPAGFLEDFGARFGDEGLEGVAGPIVHSLMRDLSACSLLGDYAAPLGVLQRLAASKPWAKAMTQLPAWLPATSQEGRFLEQHSVLGPAFGISALPDLGILGQEPTRQPDVAMQCFGGAASRRPGDLRSSMSSIQMSQAALAAQLHALLMSFLRSADTREAALAWLAAALNRNGERAKMQPDFKKASSDGFCLNLAAVLLRCCEPFWDPLAGKAWGKLDVRYTCDPGARLHQGGEVTRLGASSEEVAAWFDGALPPPDAKYHFICECFFMAARALQLGLKKALDNKALVLRHAGNYEEDAEELAGNPAPMAQMQLPRVRALAERLRAATYCYDAALQDQRLLSDVLAYYRLSAVYMVRLASPTAAAGGPPTLPLPDPPLQEMLVLPEYCVEDLCEALLLVGHVAPQLVESRRMEDFMLFFTTFLGSPDHVKNAYLRGKMAEVLHSYMPHGEGQGRGAGARLAGDVATLFEVHPLVVSSMIPSLLRLYIDVEITLRHNTFYEKYQLRYQIGEVLVQLCALPQHRAAWRQSAATNPKLSVQFIHMMLNDSQYLLQQALETLPKVQETERLQADEAAWAALPQAEREEREKALRQAESHLKYDFHLASIVINLMQTTAGDPALAGCYFDAAVRNRAAKINDFFLKYLTLPEERKKLRVREPERFGWHPKQLITQLAQIHLHLYRARRTEWVEAVAADTDYLGRAPQLLTELVAVLRALGLLPEDDVAALEALNTEVEQRKAALAAEEEAFEDVPEEYEDPLLGGLMREPVQLPSGNVVERSSIVQQLLTDPRDPYSRARCTEEDLVPLPQLKAKIEAWVEEQRSKRRMAVD